MTALALGAGRRIITDIIKPEVGIIFNKNIGDLIKSGDEICIIHADTENDFNQAKKEILQSFILSENPVEVPDLFYETF